MSELVYGLNPVLEVVRAGRRQVHEILSSRKEQVPGAKRATRKELDRLVGDVNHQGVVATVSAYPYVTLADLSAPIESVRRLLVLDSIQDPQNLGAMLRTAEAAGLTGAIIGQHQSVGVTAAVVKASAGASEHMSVARVRNIADSLATLKEAGYWTVGLDVEGSEAAGSIYDTDLDMDIALVVGAEGRGIRPRVRSLCDLIVYLPMAGKVGSLNASAAVAAAVFWVLKPSK